MLLGGGRTVFFLYVTILIFFLNIIISYNSFIYVYRILLIILIFRELLRILMIFNSIFCVVVFVKDEMMRTFVIGVFCFSWEIVCRWFRTRKCWLFSRATELKIQSDRYFICFFFFIVENAQCFWIISLLFISLYESQWEKND